MAIQFVLAYYTHSGLEINGDAFAVPKEAIIGEAIIGEADGKPLINYVCHIQTIHNGAHIYAVVNHTSGWFNPAEQYSKGDILAKLIAGDLDIGFIAADKPNVIKHIYPFHDEKYEEIRLHYTTDRSVPSNIAWRTITWDLFDLVL